jgi:hypothetical protein
MVVSIVMADAPMMCGGGEFQFRPPNQPVFRSAMPSDVEGPTDRDRVGFGFKTEISRCALDLRMAQKRSNRLQIASAFQNVESLRPA